MALNPIVRLPNPLIEQCWDFAQTTVGDYACGLNLASQAFSYRDADKDVEVWAIAKMSECAFAIFAGIDPKYGLHWERRPDGGHDLTWLGQRWDVKNTKMHCRCLLWSKAKKDIFESTSFDRMVLVKASWPLSDFLIRGWISKEDFREKRQTADRSRGDRLDDGTWFVDEQVLNTQFEVGNGTHTNH